MDLARNIDIGIASDHARSGATRVRRALDSIKAKSREVALSASRDTKTMSYGFSYLRRIVVALGVTLAARSLIQSTKNFGQAIADLSAITGATGKDLDYLRMKSKEFGETTTLSASEAAEAFKLIASAKPDLLENVKALSTVTKEAIALAEATGQDLPTAAATLGTSLNQFSADADEASRFINVLAAGAKRGASEVANTSEALKYAGVNAAVAKISFEQTNAAIQLLSTYGIKGGEAGTQLRGVLLALASQSKSQFNPEIVGLSKALENLQAANLSTADATTLFGRRNLAAGRILLGNVPKLDKLTEQLTGTTVAYEQQHIRTNTLEGDVKALKSAYEGLELTIGSQITGALRGLTQAATENIRAMSRSPWLQHGITDTLNFVSMRIQDIINSWKSLTEIVGASGRNAAVWAGIWQGAIENIARWTSYLWQQFVVGGPANLKLAFTLMIAAADRFRIALVEKGTLAAQYFVKGFVLMGNAVGRTFDAVKVYISQTLNDIINSVYQRVHILAENLSRVGLDEQARKLSEFGIALAKSGSAYETAITEQARQAEQARQDEEAAINAKIEATKEAAEVQRQASRDAVDGAIAERDATIAAIEALRQKTFEEDKGTAAAAATPEATVPSKPVSNATDKAKEDVKSLKQVALDSLDDIAGGFADMAASGKASFADLARSVIQDIIRIYLKSQILNSLSALFGGAFGGAAAQALTPITVTPLTHTPLHAAQGLDFMVGGSGGTDSQLLSLRASPGEHVSIKTPQQQRENVSGPITFKQYNTIHAEGSDAARIEAIMPQLLEENRQRTLRDVIRLRDKGALRK